MPHQEIEESEISTLHKQISSYHTELNNRNEEIYELCKKVQSLEKRVENTLFSFKNTNAKNLNFSCDAEVNTFKWILVLAKPFVKRYHLKLTFEDHLLLVLMRIKLGLLNKDIEMHLNIHNSRVSKIFRNWIPRLANVLSS